MSTKQPISDGQLDWWASYLETQAAKYRDMAKRLRENKLPAVELTGWPTLTQRVTKLLGGHSSRSLSTVDKAVDAESLKNEGVQAVKRARKKRASDKN